MIPKLSKEHILNALKVIDAKGYPANRKSRKFVLSHNGKNYPPKVVITTALSLSVERELTTEEFSGGKESNRYLQKLGFEIISLKDVKTIGQKASRKKKPVRVHKKFNESNKEKKHYKIGRIILDRFKAEKPDIAKTILKNILKKWPKDVCVDYLLTPGGFISIWFDWDGMLSDALEKEIFSRLKDSGKTFADYLFDKKSLEKLQTKTRFVFAGIDVSCVGSSNKEAASEFIFFKNVKSHVWDITGKSYPTMRQQNHIIKFDPLDSHFIEVDNEKIMILGCHDLNLFNPRTIKEVLGWRREIVEKFGKLAAIEKPTIVLQHPHTSDTPGTWRNTWINLKKLLPTVREFAGSGAYYRDDGERGSLEDCLAITATNDVLNIVVSYDSKYEITFEQNKSKFKFL